MSWFGRFMSVISGFMMFIAAISALFGSTDESANIGSTIIYWIGSHITHTFLGKWTIYWFIVFILFIGSMWLMFRGGKN